MRLRYPDIPGQLGRITSAIGEVDGLIGAVDIVSVDQNLITRDIGISATDVGLVRHRQTKEPVTDRPRLNHRATSRLYSYDGAAFQAI